MRSGFYRLAAILTHEFCFLTDVLLTVHETIVSTLSPYLYHRFHVYYDYYAGYFLFV